MTGGNAHRCGADPPLRSRLVQARALGQQHDEDDGPRGRAQGHRQDGVVVGSAAHAGRLAGAAYSGRVDPRTRRFVTLAVLVSLTVVVVVAALWRS